MVNVGNNRKISDMFEFWHVIRKKTERMAADAVSTWQKTSS